MELIEDEYEKIIEAFPNAALVNNFIFHVKIPLINDVILDIDYKKYPKRPKVELIKENGQVYDNLDTMILSLKRWKKKNPISIADLIREIFMFVKNIQSNEILIKKELIEGIMALCREQHPREILGLIRMDMGIATEFILPPGALTSNSSGIFFPSRLPLDPTLEGTVHSHPSGNPNPSLGDFNNVFKLKRFHFILAYPYSGLNCVKCFDKNGKELEFRIIN
ncbi:MAG: Mov34/MPN/PAD-1 family protein [Candidatus Hodarchaeota archaeon]